MQEKENIVTPTNEIINIGLYGRNLVHFYEPVWLVLEKNWFESLLSCEAHYVILGHTIIPPQRVLVRIK